MNTISQTSAASGIQQLFASSSFSQVAEQAPPPPRATGASLQSIEGADGQSLVDIRDELEAAAQAAFDAFDGEGDFRADVKDAIRSTLEENGFDVEEVESAMGPKPPRGGGPPPQRSDSDSSGSSFGANFVESFLNRFSEGTNLDLVG